jgi:hypothetical protein
VGSFPSRLVPPSEVFSTSPPRPRDLPLGPDLRVSRLASMCLCCGVGSSCSSEVREGSVGLEGIQATPNDGHSDNT